MKKIRHVYTVKNVGQVIELLIFIHPKINNNKNNNPFLHNLGIEQ